MQVPTPEVEYKLNVDIEVNYKRKVGINYE